MGQASRWQSDAPRLERAAEPGESPGPSHRVYRFGQVERGRFLVESFKLRYRVFCLDKGFLPPDAYPDGIEVDAYDDRAMHFVALDPAERVVGTARLIVDSELGLPLDPYVCRKCSEKLRALQHCRVGEISRLAISLPRDHSPGANRPRPVRPWNSVVALGLYREICIAGRSAGITHFIVAMERSLSRLLAIQGFPFQAVGPEVDYHGPVRPYLLDAREGERAIAQAWPYRLPDYRIWPARPGGNLTVGARVGSGSRAA
jgi:N-acyl amino acid synthase of PEP-CTERM/exosortase system